MAKWSGDFKGKTRKEIILLLVADIAVNPAKYACSYHATKCGATKCTGCAFGDEGSIVFNSYIKGTD